MIAETRILVTIGELHFRNPLKYNHIFSEFTFR